jgi:hypothetical protein
MKMDEKYIFVLGFIVIIISTIIRFMTNGNKKDPRETLAYNDIEKMFFYKIRNGDKSYKLLSIYTPFDLMMVRSLLLSEQIPYYVEFEHLMKVRPFVHILNYNNSNLYILEEDYDDAIIVIDNYIKTKELNKYKIKNTFRNIFEFLLIGWVIPAPNNILGIDVNYKKTGR